MVMVKSIDFSEQIYLLVEDTGRNLLTLEECFVCTCRVEKKLSNRTNSITSQ
jgi:hypothetical protein